MKHSANKLLPKAKIALAITTTDATAKADLIPPARNPDERSYGEVIEDVSISTAVKSKLVWNKYTNGLSIEVESRGGVVTLKGTTGTSISKELAGKLAINTHGVTSVDNQLEVSEPSHTLSDDLTRLGQDAGQQISDSWITTKVKSTLIYSRNVQSSNLSVSTVDGIVTLSGKLDSGTGRALAIELAQSIRGVNGVDSSSLEI